MFAGVEDKADVQQLRKVLELLKTAFLSAVDKGEATALGKTLLRAKLEKQFSSLGEVLNEVEHFAHP